MIYNLDIHQHPRHLANVFECQLHGFFLIPSIFNCKSFGIIRFCFSFKLLTKHFEPTCSDWDKRTKSFCTASPLPSSCWRTPILFLCSDIWRSAFSYFYYLNKVKRILKDWLPICIIAAVSSRWRENSTCFRKGLKKTRWFLKSFDEVSGIIFPVHLHLIHSFQYSVPATQTIIYSIPPPFSHTYLSNSVV